MEWSFLKRCWGIWTRIMSIIIVASDGWFRRWFCAYEERSGCLISDGVRGLLGLIRGSLGVEMWLRVEWSGRTITWLRLGWNSLEVLAWLGGGTICLQRLFISSEAHTLESVTSPSARSWEKSSWKSSLAESSSNRWRFSSDRRVLAGSLMSPIPMQAGSACAWRAAYRWRSRLFYRSVWAAWVSWGGWGRLSWEVVGISGDKKNL